MRRGELLGLMWDRVDFGRGVIHVHAKTVTGMVQRARQVPMSPKVREVLLSLRRDRKGDFVIHSRKGKRVETSSGVFDRRVLTQVLTIFTFMTCGTNSPPGWAMQVTVRAQSRRCWATQIR
jgi:integrase